MNLNICNDRRIKLPHSITFNDINEICIKLNLPKSVGNVIDLPLTDDWKTIMNTNTEYNRTSNVRFHNLRRIIFYVPFGTNREITTFSTDYTVNFASVLTNEDVVNIFNAVREIRNDKKKQLHDTLIDPVTLELLVDPMIASDGITYSKATLKRLFDDFEHPISPITRKPLTRINDTYGVKNILVSQIIELFF